MRALEVVTSVAIVILAIVATAQALDVRVEFNSRESRYVESSDSRAKMFCDLDMQECVRLALD